MTDTQTSEREERWTLVRSFSEQYSDVILRDEETNRRHWYEAHPDMFELVEVVPAALLTQLLEAMEALIDTDDVGRIWLRDDGGPTAGAIWTVIRSIRAKLSDTKEAGT